MKRTRETSFIKHSTLAASLTACLCLGFAAPLLAAQPPKSTTAHNPSGDTSTTPRKQLAKKCLSDLRKDCVRTDVRNWRHREIAAAQPITGGNTSFRSDPLIGVDEKYVPAPWEDFKITGDTNLLVPDTTKSNMDAAPRVQEDQFSSHGSFGQQSKKATDYWKTRSSK